MRFENTCFDENDHLMRSSGRKHWGDTDEIRDRSRRNSGGYMQGYQGFNVVAWIDFDISFFFFLSSFCRFARRCGPPTWHDEGV